MEIKNAVCVRCYNEIKMRGIKLKQRNGSITKLEFFMELKRLGDLDCYICHAMQKCLMCQTIDNLDAIKEKLIASV